MFRYKKYLQLAVSVSKSQTKWGCVENFNVKEWDGVRNLKKTWSWHSVKKLRIFPKILIKHEP